MTILRPAADAQPLTGLGLEPSSRIKTVSFSPVDYGGRAAESPPVEFDLKPVSKRITWDGLQSFGRRFSIIEALSAS